MARVRGASLFLLLFLIMGGSVSATELPQLVIFPDKGFYRPGETVQITVRTDIGASVEARITYLTEELEIVNVPVEVEQGEARFTWMPPPEAPRGYGLSVHVLDENGAVIAMQTSAFDVLNRWIDAPRYGFLSDFSAARLIDTPTIEWMLQHHINGVQFYDWQYRW